MILAIFFKEYLKTRKSFLILVFLNLAILAYIYIDTRQLFSVEQAEMVWYRFFHLGQLHFELLKFVPFFTGALISCIQYFPEMQDERLRLSLHLPVSPHRLILAHLLVGLTMVISIIGLDLVGLAAVTALYFPREGVWLSLLTVMPWGLAGLAAYFGGALTLLEPDMKQRIFNMMIAAGTAGSFLFFAEPGGYVQIVVVLLLPLILMIPAVLLPAYHFRFRGGK